MKNVNVFLLICAKIHLYSLFETDILNKPGNKVMVTQVKTIPVDQASYTTCMYTRVNSP